jgi:hypothetical protein
MPTIRETVRKVKEFSNLSEGWHFGEGAPIPLDRVTQAERFLEFGDLIGIKRTNVFPGIHGQVEATFYIENRTLEITIESDDSITIAEECDSEQVYFAENLIKRAAYSRLEEFGQNLWASSDLYIASITTRSEAVLQLPPSTSEVENRFPLSIVIAQQPRATRFVGILPGITTNRLGTRRFTGQYPMQLFLPGAESKWKDLEVETNAIGTSTTGKEPLLPGFLGG